MDIFEAFEELNSIYTKNKNLKEDANPTFSFTEEDRKEVERLCAKIRPYVEITPIWPTASDPSISKGRIYVNLNDKPFDYEVDPDDFDDYDYFKTDDVLDKLEKLYGEERLWWVADSLGISEESFDAALKTGELIDIPGSSWKLLAALDVSIVGDEPEVTSHWSDPGDYWNPPEGEFEYDETAKVQMTFYLVKLI